MCDRLFGIEGVVPEKASVSFIPNDGSKELKLPVNSEPENVDGTRASEILAIAMVDLEISVSLGDRRWCITPAIFHMSKFCMFSDGQGIVRGQLRKRWGLGYNGKRCWEIHYLAT